MNEATIKITGVERELLTGSDFFDYFTEPQMAEKYIRKYSQKDLLLTHHLPFVTKRKIDRCLFNGSVYKDDQGMSWELLL
jgi:hypothetical protein